MLLLILILIPFIVGILSWQSERFGLFMPRWVALVGISTVFFITLFLWKSKYYFIINRPLESDFASKWLLEYMYPWFPRFGINFHLALDGLSLLMVILSGFLGLISILCSWHEIKRCQGLFYLNLMWVLGGSFGIFLSIDMFLFFFFWEIMLVPMYFLISLWGHKESSANTRVNVATKFFLYTQFSGLFMLISIITLVSINHSVHGFWSFNYQDLLTLVLPQDVEYLLMLGFFFAFAVKMPIVPFHTWLADAHTQAPTAGSIDLSGILLKTAAYGFIRFSLPLFPDSSKFFAPIAMSLGIITIFYGAFMALAQNDMKRFIACANVSHMGFVLIAIYGENQLSYQGAVVHMIAHSLSASGMFVLCGQLYERLKTRDMRLMGGLWNYINLMPAFFLCFVVATFALPGTGNFIGEILILFGTFQKNPIIAIAGAFGMIFSAIYSLVLMQRIYYGSSCRINQFLINMSLRENFIIIMILVSIFFIGLFPQIILNTSYIAVMYDTYK